MFRSKRGVVWLEDLADAGRGRARVVVVPGQHVGSLTAEVPPRVSARAQAQILRGSFGRRLAAPADDTYVVPLSPVTRKASRRTALVVDKARLRGWYDAVSAAGVRVTAMVPDYLCLPEVPEGWTIGVLDRAPDMLLVRYAGSVGFSDHVASGIALMERELDTTEDTPRRIDVYAPQPPGPLAQFLSTCRARGIEVTLHSDPPRLEPPKGVSLLTGTLVDDAAMRGFLRQLRVPVAACLLALAAWGVNTWLDIRELSREADALRGVREQLFAEIVGPAVPMVDVRAQVGRAVSGMRDAARDMTASATFPDVLARVAPALFEHPATVRHMRFYAQAITLSLETDSYASLDQLQAALGRQGVSVNVEQSVRQDDNMVNATLVTRLQERPSQ